MWKEDIKKIEEEKEMYGEKINEGVDEKTIKIFREELKKQLNVDLPNEYAEILKTLNGLEFNGYILYGIDKMFIDSNPNQSINGILEMNTIWYENDNQKIYLFLGESNITWYVYVIDTHEYLTLDNPSGRVLDKYNAFDEMFNQMLEESLL